MHARRRPPAPICIAAGVAFAVLAAAPLAGCQQTTYRYKGITGAERTEITGSGVTVKSHSVSQNTGLHSSGAKRTNPR